MAQPSRTVCLTRSSAIAVLASFIVAGCGGGDDDSPAVAAAAKTTLTGIAATGAPIAGATVKVVNASGASATATTAADGSYTVSVDDAAPYALTVTDTAGRAWYSYAAQAGVANITPLSTLALSKAFGNKPLTQLVDGWAASRLDANTVLGAATQLNANFKALLQANGVDASSFNVFSSTFAANHSGFDAVLDGLRVQFSCTATSCTEQINGPTGATLLTWNASASTAGINLSFSGGGTSGTVSVNLGACKSAVAGTWSVLIDTTVDGVGAGLVPQICVDGLPGAPASQAEFCSSADFKSQLPPGVEIVSCSFAGNVGTYNVRLTSPVLLAYTVKYSFVKR